jgi:U3 small nucleolar RNA-associated protein 25
MFSYQDIFHIASTTENVDSRNLYCLHVLNEVLKLRARITRNNERLTESPEMEAKDQGFARPRILILAPLRNTALDVIKTLGKLWMASSGQVDNQQRLQEEFGPSEEDQERAQRPNMDPDFAYTFRDNIDDCFRIGIKCTRKSMKLFSDFYSSDIIVASPMGLRFVIDGQTNTKRIGRKKKRIKTKGDHDFLSSIQTVIIEQADIISMQNWEHLLHVFEHLNKLPKDAHGCDFSRVQSIFLDGIASSTRQNILFSQLPLPEIHALTKRFGNCAGQLRIQRKEYPGLLKKTPLAKPQLHLIQGDSLEAIPQIRLEYFITTILQNIPQSVGHICIFIPSYLDFVQLREYMVKHEMSHTVLSEYCTPPEISAARTRFFNGQARILLVTERFHFFKRYRIRGTSRLIFFGLPDHAEYYQQWCETLEREGDVPIIVSSYDYLKAERILGTKRMAALFPE